MVVYRWRVWTRRVWTRRVSTVQSWPYAWQCQYVGRPFETCNPAIVWSSFRIVGDPDGLEMIGAERGGVNGGGNDWSQGREVRMEGWRGC